MPGPPDQVVTERRPNEVPQQSGHTITPDRADTPREAHSGSGTDLGTRLKHLRPSHPSSPFNDDGSRKPLSPDTSDRELPLPSEQDVEPSPRTDPDLPEPGAEDRARVAPDGSWEWKGHHLSADRSRIADQVLQRCQQVEGRDADGKYGPGGLTPAMRRIESRLEHGQLVEDTEKHALKSPDRFKEKLARLILRNPDESPEKLAHEIHDTVRYTFTFDEDKYSEGVSEAHRELVSDGNELEVRRNLWTGDEYKGINTRWRDSVSGVRFEVQFHTQASWETKQRTHHAYERIEDPRTPPDESKRLRAYQREVSSRVEVPPGALDVTDYRKEDQ
jgi:hypothetical protein